MLLLQHGTLGDRPWGAMLAATGLGGRTCQVNLRVGDKRYAIAFTRGAIVGAISPMSADAVARIAVREGLIKGDRAPVLAKGRKHRLRDELATFIRATDLTPADITRLKRLVLLQRAARTFALAR